MKGDSPLLLVALAAVFAAASAQFDCPFETDLCRWVQAQSTDNFDWKIISGGTATPGTGPTHDHTSGNGQYAYFESSVGTNGDKAQLVSPTVTVTTGHPMCLVFYYTMYGQHVNALNVYQKTNTGSMKIVWTRQGNQGTSWMEERINLPVETNFQVVIEAVRGRGWKGDIAIDDTKTVNGQCPPLGTILPSVPVGAKTTPMPVSTSCNFETRLVCGYTQDKTDDFDWRWSTGYTASAMTGPSNDHTYGTAAGHYMYIESGDDQPNKKARLISPTLPGSNTRCLQFWYSMFDQHVNSLHVYAKSRSLGNAIWSMSGDQGMDWNVAQVTISSGSNYNIVFEAVRGAGNKGNIAVDDVLLKQGSCPLPVTPTKARQQTATTTASTTYKPTSSMPAKSTVATPTVTPTKARQQTATTTATTTYKPTSSMPAKSTVATPTVTPTKARQQTATTTATTTYKPTSSMPAKSTVATPTAQKSVTCNFDTDMCSWVQMKNDNFDWTRSTFSFGTGPFGDHTTGHGSYLYTEVSSVQTIKTARIQSKIITPFQTTQCLSFFYHMHCDQIGTLNAYIKSTPTIGKPVWTRTGDQGTGWIHARITVSRGHTPYSVVIESVSGSSYCGDIAIDDIQLIDGPCTGATVSGPTVHTTVNPGQTVRKCDFEARTICSYVQDKTDNFDWSWTSHTTSSYETGPSNDHTYGTTSGHYIFTEASRRSLGNKARIMTPIYHDHSAMCVQFYYHMYGNGMGAFKVYAKVGTSATSLGRSIFSMTGNQGNKWIVGQATIPSSTAAAGPGYQVVFEGTVGSNYRSDIAVDDVTFRAGACSNPGDCTFETGLCTWKNTAVGDKFDWTQDSGGTSSVSTGPSVDHTLGTRQGKYMYIEASAPRLAGDKAWMLSQNFPPVTSGGRCMNFWYSMYGQTVDTLNFYIRVQGRSDYLIWHQSGNHGSGWNYGQVPITERSKSYSIVNEGVRGRSFSGDIAIDDITFSPWQCSLIPPSATAAPQTTQQVTT